MSVQTRPSDLVTEDFLLLGLPIVEFAHEIVGGFDPYFALGIVDSAEIAKSIQLAQLRSAQSGTSKLVRELVRQFDATLNVGLFRHSGENMQFMFASASLASVNSAVVVITDDPFILTTDAQDFRDLSNQNLVEPITGVECDDITAEDVGTGDGTLGDASGDYSLDFKPNVIGDVTSVTVGGVAYTPIAVGTATTGNQVEIVVGASATSGDMQFFVGGVAANVTGAILATYRPTFAFVENTDYVVDYKAGRVRILQFGGATDPLKASQPMRADYSYNEAEHQLVQPYSRFVFPGKCRIRQLTDVGENIVWEVPKVQVRLTEDAFTFNRDDFTVTTVAIEFLEDQSDPSKPYGDMKIYREGTF